jgi:RNA polymerase sigma-70 factor (ECF subfamily)
MDRYARGDPAAFADVYDTVAPSVHAYLVRQTRDRGRAEDLLQQTLLQMHRSRGSYIPGLPVMPWAFAIARRLFIDELRHRKVDALSSARGIEAGDRVTPTGPEAEALGREMAELVEAELDRIPEAQRTAFELLRVEGLSQDEAAQRLGTTVSAVKLRAFRAYAALRAALGHPLVTAVVAGERRKP